jgi:hypothetical protein
MFGCGLDVHWFWLRSRRGLFNWRGGFGPHLGWRRLDGLGRHLHGRLFDEGLGFRWLR